MLLDDAIDDDDERTRRAADLNPAPAQQRNQQAGDNRSNQPGLRIGAGRDGDGCFG